MLYPVKIVDIELSDPIIDVAGLEKYVALKGIVKLFGKPLDYIDLPVTNNKVQAQTIIGRILETQHWNLLCRYMELNLSTGEFLSENDVLNWINVKPTSTASDLPYITVAVCTRDRTADLELCINALNRLDYPNLDILIVDNAPATDSTFELIKTKFPNVRYVVEARPGLDWARNRAIIEAKGEIIAYTDDDVIVDKGWAKAIGILFSENPEVMAATGLVVPYEIETEAQALFEEYGGFGRGFKRKWASVEKGHKISWRLLGTGQFGTGANMAYRRSVFNQIGLFDPALDVGTVTNGGGDLEMFFRVLKEGFTLVYEPAAMVRHRHRREYEKLKIQLTNNGSLYSYFVAGAKKYPNARKSFLKLGSYWMRYWNLRRYLLSFFSPGTFPRDLIKAELKGGLNGLSKYQKACKKVTEIEEKFGHFPALSPNETAEKDINKSKCKGTGIRMLELSEPIEPMYDVQQYSSVRVYASWKGNPLGKVEIANQGGSISKSRLIEDVVSTLLLKLLNIDNRYLGENAYSKALDNLTNNFSQKKELSNIHFSKLPSNVSVTVMLSTFNRPDDLRNCLRCLTAQETDRSFEIIVVDNCPSSGLTPPVLKEFPEVILVNESRQGVAYARNTGIIASKGDIIITTDDDVTMPADWMEKIIAPFSRADIVCVTGNILPVELATRSQQLFEEYGGLGRGYKRFEVNHKWFNHFHFRAVPVWHLGGTANSAFRACIFKDHAIGLMDETLGPGMPSGVGEDSYLFYKILKANYTILYEPTAFVWHNHRRSMKALKKQIYNYSKGHIAHHLTTLIHDKDKRSLIQLFFRLPQAHFYRIKMRLAGKSNYPLRMIFLEILGNVTGPWAFYKSWRKVKKQGRSSFYNPSVELKNPEVLFEKQFS